MAWCDRCRCWRNTRTSTTSRWRWRCSRALTGLPSVEPQFPPEGFLSRYHGLDGIQLRQGDKRLSVPVADWVTTLVPFRGPGGVSGGSYRYVSAADVLAKRLAPEA